MTIKNNKCNDIPQYHMDTIKHMQKRNKQCKKKTVPTPTCGNKPKVTPKTCTKPSVTPSISVNIQINGNNHDVNNYISTIVNTGDFSVGNGLNILG